MLRFSCLLLLALIFLAGCQKQEQAPMPIPDYLAWYAEHTKTCPICADPDTAPCEEVLQRWDATEWPDVDPRDGKPIKR